MVLLAITCMLGTTANASAQPTASLGTDHVATETFSLEEVIRRAMAQSHAILTGREEVEASQGNWQAARGAFDMGMNASVAASRDNTLHTQAQRQQLQVPRAESGRSTYRMGVSKRFRSDIVVTPSVEVARTDAYTLDNAPVLRTGANLNVAIPLLRKSGAADSEDAARRSLAASQQALRFAEDQSAQQAAAAYWSYLAAYQSLSIYEEAETRAQRLLDETQALVERDERPVADLDPLRANLSDKAAQRVSAQQRVFEARQQLRRALGLPSDEAARLVVPDTPFPTPAADITVPKSQILETHALERRADLQEAQAHAAAAGALLDARERETRPRFDIELDLGYAGMSEGSMGVSEYAPPLGQNEVSGANASLTLVYDWSMGNNRAQGALAQQQATLQQRQLAAEELRRQIRSGVAVAADQLQSVATELGSARAAVRLYEEAVANERKKLRLGMSTLFDVTTVADRLTSAQLARVSAQARYAQALARLRLETGTVEAQARSPEALVQTLTSIPAAASQP